MFVRRVIIDPASGKGRLGLYRIPRIQALPPADDKASKSSLLMVAGAGDGIDPRPEEPPVIPFTWGRGGVKEAGG